MGSGSFLKVLVSNIDVLAGYGHSSPSPSLYLLALRRPLPAIGRFVGRCSVVSWRLMVGFVVDSVRAVPSGVGKVSGNLGWSLCRLC